MKCAMGNFQDEFKLTTINTSASEDNFSSSFVPALIYKI